MTIRAFLLFALVLTGMITSAAAFELGTKEPLYMGQPISISGVHPHAEEGAEIFVAVYPGYSGAATVPGPERSGAELEDFSKTGIAGAWNYQFTLNSVPGEYMIYADFIGTSMHETLIVPILYCSSAPAAPAQTPPPNPIIPQPDLTAIPTLSEIEAQTPLGLLPLLAGLFGGLSLLFRRKTESN